MSQTFFVPSTLKELIQMIGGFIHDPKSELTGEEQILDAYVVQDTDEDVPPNTICLSLRANTMDPDKPKHGVLYLVPKRSSRLM